MIAIRRSTWKEGGRSEQQFRSAFAAHVLPRIGRKRVSKVSGADLMALLLANDLWNRRRATARRILQWLGVVFQWSIAEGHRADNPVLAIRAALPANGVRVRHQQAIPHAEVGDALAKVRASTSRPATRLCFEFLVLTAARSGEARKSTWTEIDMASATWTVPAARTKSGRTHRVPLTGRALDLLAEAAKIADGSGFVFPGARGGPVGEKTLSALPRQLSIPAVPHGFRTSFRTWAGESGVSRELAERCLAHAVKSQAEAAYARSDLLERRREVMRAWADYACASMVSGARCSGGRDAP